MVILIKFSFCREKMAFFTRLSHPVPEVPSAESDQALMMTDVMTNHMASSDGGGGGSSSSGGAESAPAASLVVAATNPRNYPLVRQQGPPPNYGSVVHIDSIDEEDDQGSLALGVDV